MSEWRLEYHGDVMHWHRQIHADDVRTAATPQDLESLGQLGVDVDQAQFVGKFGQCLQARLDGE
ncbi:hypothetical protein FT669_01725 [Aeromonas jandaei]|nr:hypothetical protein FT669_01725 [Aeromonas jandaei]